MLFIKHLFGFVKTFIKVIKEIAEAAKEVAELVKVLVIEAAVDSWIINSYSMVSEVETFVIIVIVTFSFASKVIVPFGSYLRSSTNLEVQAKE